MRLLWSDEFEGAPGTRPDQTKWTYDLGGGGWGNRELQAYTDSAENVFLDGNGRLVIRALRLPGGGYSSARLKSKGLFSFRYGRIEARIKVPVGQGLWPALWLLGSDIDRVSWPESGEIDVMEYIGREPTRVYGGVHGPGYSGDRSITGFLTMPNGDRVADAFRVFAANWGPDVIEFYVDSTLYHSVSRAQVGGERWRFAKQFYLLLNVAVGGQWPGNPDATTSFPQEMVVDYVRVFQSAVDSTPEPKLGPLGALNAASFAASLSPGALATLFGTELSTHSRTSLFDASTGAFPLSSGSTTVMVERTPAPLLFVSPDQINFQVPWSAPVGVPLQIAVSRDGKQSDKSSATLLTTAPAVFAAGGIAILTCSGPESPGSVCTLWGTGFGAKSVAQRDGTPSGPDPLPWSVSPCRLAIAGTLAEVKYCGASPGLIIDQLNFLYPDVTVRSQDTFLPATLMIGDAGSELLIPIRR
jgi:uncharacterized protein (TIGR03437 family)